MPHPRFSALACLGVLAAACSSGAIDRSGTGMAGGGGSLGDGASNTGPQNAASDGSSSEPPADGDVVPPDSGAGSTDTGASSDASRAGDARSDSRAPPGPVVAFPGAVGFGRTATGGRGGSVYHVTTLADSGAGSFRDAVSSGPRIVVFDVGGTISLSTPVSAKGNLTIAGQTAPGDGIAVIGRETSFSGASNDIVRYMRFRQGTLDSDNTKSGINLLNATTMIFDHMSVEFAQWNNIDSVGASNITVQHSISRRPDRAAVCRPHRDRTLHLVRKPVRQRPQPLPARQGKHAIRQQRRLQLSGRLHRRKHGEYRTGMGTRNENALQRSTRGAVRARRSHSAFPFPFCIPRVPRSSRSVPTRH